MMADTNEGTAVVTDDAATDADVAVDAFEQAPEEGASLADAIENARADVDPNDEPVPDEDILLPGDLDAEVEADVADEIDEALDEAEGEVEDDEPEEELTDEDLVEDDLDPEAEDADEDAEDDDEEEAETYTAQLPGRNPDDPDVEIEVDDPELVERINQLRNGYMRGEAAREEREAARRARTEVDQEINEIQSFYDELATDPVNVILDNVQDEVKEEIAAHILVSDDEVFDKVLDRFKAAVQDPEKMEGLRAKMALKRREMADKAQDLVRDRRHRRTTLQQTQGVLRDLASQVHDTNSRNQFARTASGLIAQHIKALPEGQQYNPAHIPEILANAGTLQHFGIDPELSAAGDGDGDVQSGSATDAGGTTAQSNGKGSAPKAAEKSGPRRVKARRKVKDPKGAVERRKNVASTARGGDGAASSAKFRPTKGADVKEALKQARTHMQKS